MFGLHKADLAFVRTHLPAGAAMIAAVITLEPDAFGRLGALHPNRCAAPYGPQHDSLQATPLRQGVQKLVNRFHGG